MGEVYSARAIDAGRLGEEAGRILGFLTDGGYACVLEVDPTAKRRPFIQDEDSDEGIEYVSQRAVDRLIAGGDIAIWRNMGGEYYTYRPTVWVDVWNAVGGTHRGMEAFARSVENRVTQRPLTRANLVTGSVYGYRHLQATRDLTLAQALDLGSWLGVVVMRHWPRGVHRASLWWEPEMAPSETLLADYQHNLMFWENFAQCYQAEIAPRLEAWREHLQDILTRHSYAQGIVLLCHERDVTRMESGVQCHRRLLREALLGPTFVPERVPDSPTLTFYCRRR